MHKYLVHKNVLQMYQDLFLVPSAETKDSTNCSWILHKDGKETIILLNWSCLMVDKKETIYYTDQIIHFH